MMRENNILHAISYMLLGMLFFSSMDAGIKWLAENYSPFQILFFRGLFGFLPILISLPFIGGTYHIKTFRPGLHILRGLLGCTTAILFFTAFKTLSLVNVIVIGFASPMITTVLSSVLLKEKVGIFRTSAVFIGFVGVLIMIQPDQGALEIGSIFAIFATIFYAFSIITIRHMSWSESSMAIVFWNNIIWFAVSLIFLPFIWVTPNWTDLGVFLCVGFLGFASHFCITQSLQSAQPAIVTPFEYSALLWATLLGALFWNEWPSDKTYIGASVIISASLVILYREYVLQNKDKKRSMKQIKQKVKASL